MEQSGAISGYHAHRDANALSLTFEALVGGGAESVLVDVGEDDSCARLGEGTRRGEAPARARTRDERDLAGEAYAGWP